MAAQKYMHGVQLLGHGDLDQLVWNEKIPVPLAGPGEVLVKVLAAGVNNTDINTRLGWYAKEVTGATDTAPTNNVADGGWGGALPFPLVQGGDLCGEVAKIGSGVTGFAIGMRVICANVQPEPTAENPHKYAVIGSEYDGAFAQYCVVPARHLYDVTTSPLTDIEMAAVPCAYGTAMGLLRRAGVGAADKVLITGASGGVGMACVQLAKIAGAAITGVAGPAKQAAVRGAGADHVISRSDVPEHGFFDVVIDVVGGPAWGDLIEALASGGRYAVAGAIAGPIVTGDLRTIYLNDLSLYGSTFQPADGFAALVAMVNQGGVRPLVSKTYPLRDIHAAQTDFLSKSYPGKLVLIP